MGSPINPVVSGLLGGFQLAHYMNSQRLEEARFEEQKRRDDEAKAVRDLQTQMALSDRGYKPATPDQEAELMTGLGIGRSAAGYAPSPGGEGDVPQAPVGGIIGGVAAPVKSDIKTRTAKFQGQNYVRPSDQELDAQSEIATRRDLARRMTEASALGDVATQQAVTRAQKMLEATGFEVDPVMAKKLHIKPGTKFPAEKIDDLMRAFSNEQANQRNAAPKVQRSFLTRENGGNVTSVLNDGTVKVSAGLGLPAEEKKAGITPYQQIQLDRQKKADAERAQARLAEHQAAQSAVNDHQKEINRLNEEEQKLHKDNIEIGQSLNAGVNVRTKARVTASDARALHKKLEANVKAISALQAKQALRKQAQNGILMRFAGRPPLAGYGAAPDDGIEDVAPQADQQPPQAAAAAAGTGAGRPKAPPSPW